MALLTLLAAAPLRAQATQLLFDQQPTDTEVNATITPAVTVHATDGGGDRDFFFFGDITIAIEDNPGSGNLSGTLTQSASFGESTFDDLSIDEVGDGYTLEATSGGLTPDISAAFDITPGPPATLEFVQQPTDEPAGQPITPAVTVLVEDASDNPVPGVNVTMEIASGPGSFSGTSTTSATTNDSGIATFGNLRIDLVGSYTIRATSGSLNSPPSNSFDITAGNAATLEFQVQPSTTTAGQPITPAVAVLAEDASDNPVPGLNVTIEIASGPGSLSGTTSATTNSSGIATFGNLRIDLVGSYTIRATSGSLNSAPSNSFDITAGSAVALEFVQQPTSTTAGATITPAVTVRAVDGSGNTATGFNGNIAVALGTNPGGDGVLDGTTTVAAVNGVATFNDLNIDEADNGYTLQATSGSLTPDTSTPFDIIAAGAARLQFQQHPTNATAGAAIAPAVTVRAVDGSGNTVTSFSGNVTVSIGTNPGGGALFGTTTRTAVNGVATFNDLSIDRAGSGYTLLAGAGGLAGATSDAFNITPGPPSTAMTAITANPTAIPANGTSTSTITVQLKDQFGNNLTSGGAAVVLSTTGGSLSSVTDNGNGTYTATLRSSTTSQTATVTGTLNSQPIADTAEVTFTSGSVQTLDILVQPSAAPVGQNISPPIRVRVANAGGNTVTSFNGSVTVALAANPAGGTLNGTTTVTAVNGVATFGNLSIDRVGNGYALRFSSSGLASITSVTFSITTGATDLEVSIAASDPTPAEGDTLVYTVTVRNHGPQTATGVQITDDLPDRVSFVSASPSQGSYNSATGIWSVGTLANGASATLEITATVDLSP